MVLTEEQRKERKRERNKKWRESNKEYHKKWCDSNKDKISEVNRKWKENNPAKYHKSCTISQWKSNGLIDEDYESLYNKYMNTDYCERCNCKLTGNKPQTSTSRCMDHDHITGKFRNVLCLCCNSSLPKQTKKIINNIKKDEN